MRTHEGISLPGRCLHAPKTVMHLSFSRNPLLHITATGDFCIKRGEAAEQASTSSNAAQRSHPESDRMPPAGNNNAHTHQGHRTAQDICACQRNTVHKAQPQEGSNHVNATIGGVYSATGCGVQGQQPCKHRKTQAGGHKQPCRAALAQPQPGKVAPCYLRKSRYNKKRERLDHQCIFPVVVAQRNAPQCDFEYFV